MAYKLSTKEDYISGNVNFIYQTERRSRSLREARDKLKDAAKCGRKSPLLDALVKLAEAAIAEQGAKDLEAWQNLRAAQGYMWEHFNAEQLKEGGEK